MLVGNTFTSGHHARIVSPDFSLENKIAKTIRIKGIEWDRKQWHP
jgi:hypothetical protein